MAEHEELPAEAGRDAIDELNGIRQSIDNIDAALIHMLAERFKFTQQVGRLKARHGLPAADPARELQQIQRLRALAEEARLDPGFAEKFLNFIVAEVIHHHVAIAGGQPGVGDGQAAGAAIGVMPDSAIGAPAPATADPAGPAS
ncbi:MULTISPECIES: chorismate mutase [unclassified Cryobacterium]|uniref:chorismate mutase n=1 Tax=unclassified Cryobacterium TaxID=2649013 RepID=UPI002AB563BD|nr:MULTISPECIES: chorismate mutase [unclassified Cryobacterium]MDY7542337.1 chorismate mutase [Cryobacterium sp. 5B3]MEB0000343.1 chorismate mutase [Cryobacterium sp. RTS3]MEB0267785.1 chorismate mutase [Cryobacterium sp. 10I5]MEB0275918.1 chorismate mutase [Cryobacterium sp. 5B3]